MKGEIVDCVTRGKALAHKKHTVDDNHTCNDIKSHYVLSSEREA